MVCLHLNVLIALQEPIRDYTFFGHRGNYICRAVPRIAPFIASQMRINLKTRAVANTDHDIFFLMLKTKLSLILVLGVEPLPYPIIPLVSLTDQCWVFLIVQPTVFFGFEPFQ
jgi:hypothetical protein